MELIEILDPTTRPKEQKIEYAPRPRDLNGLRIGLIDNTKYNSDRFLLKIAERLKTRFGMEMVMLNRKQSAAAQVTEEAAQQLRNKTDFVIAGIGD
jgi:hypothetical protein